ncbi:eukaryotic translation initiation factor 4E-binding protein 1-like isoform X3 [Heptranchias perlo]|uniref:eukaryotic translation initiation factor 4E-binding protein 1-like isoform X3 n=1 Tax=Heptranchias perlo TaxID=212740 RepID=UPI00355938C0
MLLVAGCSGLDVCGPGGLSEVPVLVLAGTGEREVKVKVEEGTRIIYDRKFLMECRNSPVARTPPRDLPNIPGVTNPNTTEKAKPAANHVNSHEDKAAGGDDAQFEMDI